MPPESKVTMNDILEAAFAILRQSGIAAVTARAIATVLGASTTPIYRVLKSMDLVIKELRKRALEVLDDFQTRHGESIVGLPAGRRPPQPLGGGRETQRHALLRAVDRGMGNRYPKK